jgi:L-ascorbate metabolism protein UlaG (beta-lactamase superfamily)
MQHMDHLTAASIRQLMRRHRKTIRGVARTWGLTQKRVREVRAHGVRGTDYVMDWMQILTGDPHAGWEAIAAAYARTWQRKLNLEQTPQ